MTLKQSVGVKVVVAKSDTYGRLTKGKSYGVVYSANKENRYIFVLDDTGNINGYHIRNFVSGES